MLHKDQKSMPLVDKLGATMDVLFKVIGQRRVSHGFEIEVSSDSDYASDE